MAINIANLAVLLSADTSKFTNSFNKTKKPMDKLKARLTKLSVGVAAFGAVAAAAAAAALVMLTKNSLKSIDAVAKVSDKLGIATDELTKLQFAAEQTGIPINQLNLGLQRMTRRIAEAAAGTGEAKAALKELGLDAKRIASLSVDEQFKAIADAMPGIVGQSNKVRIGFKLFDSEAVGLINTLVVGRKGLEAFGKQAEELGLVFSREDALGVERANDAINRLKKAFTGLGNTLAIEVAPWLTVIANRLTGVSKELRNAKDGVIDLENQANTSIESMAKKFTDTKVGGAVFGLFLKTLTTQAGFEQLAAFGKEIQEEKDAIANAVDEMNDTQLDPSAIISPEAIANQKKAITILAGLRDKLFEIGKAETELVASRLEHLQATQEQIQEAIGLQREIDRLTKAEEKAKEAQTKLNNLQTEAENIFESTRTVVEKYEIEISKLGELLDKQLITYDTWARAVRMARGELEAFGKLDAPGAPRLIRAGSAQAQAAKFDQNKPIREQTRVEKDQLQQQKQARKLLEQIERNTKNSGTTVTEFSF